MKQLEKSFRAAGTGSKCSIKGKGLAGERERESRVAGRQIAKRIEAGESGGFRSWKIWVGG